MKVVLLAGGFGTRYLEITKKIPKPLIKVGNKPIIYQLMRHFSYYNYNDFIICCGYKFQIIFEYFIKEFQNKKDFNIKKSKNKIELNFIFKTKFWKIQLINTGLNTNTGGRIKRIEKILENSAEDNFFLTYADGLSNINLNNLIKFHKINLSYLTVSIVKIKNQYGVVNTKNNRVTSFNEKPNNPFFINGGFFILNKKILKMIKDDKDIWEKDCIPRIMKKYPLFAFKHNSFWQSMDNFHDKVKLDNYLKENNKFFYDR